MRCIVAVGLAFLAADPKQEGPATADRKLWAAISVTAPVLDWDVSTGRPFMVCFALVNDGEKAVDPEVEASQLLVTGKPLKDWSFIISNGPRDARWRKLPARDYLNFAYDLGKYFEKPGTYKVLWKGKGFQSAELVVRVMPRKRR